MRKKPVFFPWNYKSAFSWLSCCAVKKGLSLSRDALMMLFSYWSFLSHALSLFSYSYLTFPLSITHPICPLSLLSHSLGSSINDVTALGGRGYQGFCDDSTKALVMKSVTMGEGGVKNDLILRDVIYGRPLYPSHTQSLSFFLLATLT
jgi:hypothetical protein